MFSDYLVLGRGELVIVRYRKYRYRKSPKVGTSTGTEYTRYGTVLRVKTGGTKNPKSRY
ncbi:hypothetical protein HanIR_Chr03g0142731 [Helianthus annuus]|nr:hypothetical protein HanIR_Chr03g0142731 [Helianthus annuus]